MYNKRGNIRYLFVISIISFLLFLVVAQEEIKDKISNLSNETEKFIKKFVQEENDVKEENINSIEQIDLTNPPDEVKIKDVDDTNIAIFEVNYTKQDENKKLFVVTYSTEEFKVPLELKPANTIEYLNFGKKGNSNNSLYLETATGVPTSSEKGYVMIDSGSITGVSTNIEIIKSNEDGFVEVIVYKNGESTGLINLIDASNTGIQKDYDKQSSEIVRFNPGDIISVYVSVKGDVEYRDIINLVKVEIENE